MISFVNVVVVFEDFTIESTGFMCYMEKLNWINIHLFLFGKNHQRLKTYCFVFRNGCLLLAREQSNKKKQVNF